jgi:hypothetical protein
MPAFFPTRYTARGVPEMKGADPLIYRVALSALVTAWRKREDKLATLRPIIRADRADKPQAAKASHLERQGAVRRERCGIPLEIPKDEPDLSPASGLMTFESLGLASQVNVGTGAALMRSPRSSARSICHLSLTCALPGKMTNDRRRRAKDKGGALWQRQ